MSTNHQPEATSLPVLSVVLVGFKSTRVRAQVHFGFVADTCAQIVKLISKIYHSNMSQCHLKLLETSLMFAEVSFFSLRLQLFVKTQTLLSYRPTTLKTSTKYTADTYTLIFSLLVFSLDVKFFLLKGSFVLSHLCHVSDHKGQFHCPSFFFPPRGIFVGFHLKISSTLR